MNYEPSTWWCFAGACLYLIIYGWGQPALDRYRAWRKYHSKEALYQRCLEAELRSRAIQEHAKLLHPYDSQYVVLKDGKIGMARGNVFVTEQCVPTKPTPPDIQVL